MTATEAFLALYRREEILLESVLLFVSGSHKFLDTLARKIQSILNTKSKTLYKEKGKNAYYLRYSKKDCLKIFGYMYKNLHGAPYLSRKYNTYQSFLSSLSSN